MTTKTDNNFIEQLFQAGSHYGFKKSRRHPSSAKYLYTTKDGNDIFDLEKTSSLLADAKEVLKEAGLHGKTVLFVGTKDEAAKLVKEAAVKTESPYVTNRWIGGMLTNFAEIKKRIVRMQELLHEKESGELERKYTKKERVVIGREVDKLEYNFLGISTIHKLPDYLLVVDPRHDTIAVEEANEKGVPVIAIMGSDCDAGKIDLPVFGNDALQSSVSLLLNELTSAYAEGKSAYVPKDTVATKKTTTRNR
jgi:small subunit ribosomal protein S2